MEMKLTTEIQAIRERYAAEHTQFRDVGACTLCDFRDLFDHIAQLEAELAELREAERWIPVGERLPENDSRVSIHDDSILRFCSVLACGYSGAGKPYTREINRIYVRKTGIKTIDDSATVLDEWHWSKNFEHITHWRPLPQPPEAKGE